METGQSLVANLIDTAGMDARYDEQAKKLLSVNSILAWILKSCVDEFSGFDTDFIMKNCFVGTPEISEKAVHMDMPDKKAEGKYVQMMNSESNSIKEHGKFFDIRFKAMVPGTEDIIELIVNVEIQLDASDMRYLVRRAFYYCSRMMSEQYGIEFTGDDYGKIKKVVSIWICPAAAQYKQDSVIDILPIPKTTSGEFGIDPSITDVLQIVILFLKTTGEPSQNKIIRLLSTLLSANESPDIKKKILQDEFGIEMSEEFERGVKEMSVLYDSIKQSTEEEINERYVTNMLQEKMPLSMIEKISKLSEEKIREIAKKIGVAVL